MLKKTKKVIIDGILCIPPDELNKDALVLVTVKPKFNKEIVAQLNGIGVKKYLFCN